MANLGNEVYDRVMDMVLKFISLFSCEKSGPVVTELFKFLHCVSELSSRVPEDQLCEKHIGEDAYCCISSIQI